jgi:hypothetical protein
MPGEQTNDRMLRAALRYAAAGWYVFPLAEHEDVKAPHPMLGNKEGHRKATIDPDQIREWWANNPNAGIGCWLKRSGLIAVDVDPRDGGDKALVALEAKYGALETPVVGLTGGNGFHHLFRAADNLSPPGKIHQTKGLDIKYNGYIVLPPSIHPSKRRYRWREGGDPFSHINDLPEVPAWVIQRGNLPALNGSAINGHHLNGHEVDIFAEDTAPVGLSFDQMREILAKVPNEGVTEKDYQDWLEVLAGIYHETDGSEEGKALAYEWSSQAFTHDDDDFEKKYPSLDIKGKGRAPTTFRFVLKLAKERAEAAAAEALKEIKAALAAATTVAEAMAVCERIKTTDLPRIDRIALTYVVKDLRKTVDGFPPLTIGEARQMTSYASPETITKPLWLEGWRYCAEDDTFLHPQRGAIPKAAFDNLFNAEMLTHRDKLEGRTVPENTASNAALNRFEIEKVDGRRYMPEVGEIFTMDGATYLNLYRETEQPVVPETLTAEDQEAIRIVERHFRHLFPGKRDRETIQSWLAYVVQTRKRPTWAVVVQGPEGDGKSFLVKLMAVILGASNVGLVDVSILEGPFNGWAEGHLLKAVEELKMHGHSRYDTLNKLKQVITNDTIPIHRKNRDPYIAVNTAAYFITTNFRDALPITDDDSRYWMHASPRQTRAEVVAFEAANPGYFPALFGTLEDHPGALRKWMLEYPIADHFRPNGRAPESAEHKYVEQLNRTEDEDVIDDAIATGQLGLSAELLSAAALKEWVTLQNGRMPQTLALSRHLAKRGFISLGQVRIDGRLDRFYSQTPARFGTGDQRSERIRDWMSAEGL